jgi:Rho termination factor-like protein
LKGNTLTDYSKLTVPALKLKASELKIVGASTMRKAELVSAIETKLKADAPKPSFVEGIVAGIRNAKDARKLKGQYAGQQGKRTRKTRPEDKEYAFRLQRGSETAKLTSKQARRVRKTEAKLYNMPRSSMCTGFGARAFTYS